MKKFIILSGSVDGATCDDDGFINCANFDLVGTRACDTLEEALEVRKQTVETDIAGFSDIWSKEDGYIIEQGEMNNYNGNISDTYVDVYYEGDVINETIYKIREIEC